MISNYQLEYARNFRHRWRSLIECDREEVLEYDPLFDPISCRNNAAGIIEVLLNDREDLLEKIKRLESNV